MRVIMKYLVSVSVEMQHSYLYLSFCKKVVSVHP